jgi:beta-lactamase class A
MARLAFFLLVLFAFTANAQTKPKTGIGFKVSKSDFQLFMDELSVKTQGRIGVAAMLIETGETIGYRTDERFPMQSVYKFPIGMAAFYLADQGILKPDRPVQVTKADLLPDLYSPLRDKHPDGTTTTLAELIRYAVSESDNSASDFVLNRIGGGSVVTNYLQSLGIAGVVVRDPEQAIQTSDSLQYRNWATPTEMVKLLKQLQLGKGLSAQNRALLLDMMTQSPTGLNRLKGQLPPGTLVAHKTGTSGVRAGLAAATNDVGLITLPSGRHLAIAVFVADARTDLATREAAIAQIARKLWDKWQ